MTIKRLGGFRCGAFVVLFACGCSPAAEDKEAPLGVVQNKSPAVDVPLDFGFEPTLAVNPLNLGNIVVGRGTSLRASLDAGSTFPLSADAAFFSDHLPEGDPSLAFDSRGRVFLSYLGEAVDATQGGKDVFVQQFNPTTLDAQEFFTVNVSEAIGLSAVSVHDNDKAWLAADRFASSPFRDRLYLVWTDVRVPFRNGPAIVYSTFSSNQGVTWSSPVVLSNAAQDCPSAQNDCYAWPAHVAVAANGDVYAAYHVGTVPATNPTDSDGQIVIVRSSDGGVTFPFKVKPFGAGSANITFNEGTTRRLNHSFSWTPGSGQPWLLPDPTDSNRIAVVFSDDPTNTADGGSSDDMDVRISRSTNRGVNWTAPVNVPSAGNPPGSAPVGALEMFPTAAMDLNSRCLSVGWYDSRFAFTNPSRRNSAGNYLLDFFVRTSPDGGQTWGPEVALNGGVFDPDLHAEDRFPGGPLENRIGEYNGILMARGAVWTDNDLENENQPTREQRTTFDLSDRVPPVFTSVPGPVTVSAGVATDIGTPTATDVCGTAPVDFFNDAPDVFPVGVTTVTWTAFDGALNETIAAQTQTVTAELRDDATGCPEGTNVIVGTPGNDTINGTAGPDCILGLGGQDTINGLGGDDFISGGDGNDIISGGSGNDTIQGGAGQDQIDGGIGDDKLDGDEGDDTVSGGSGNDTIHGGDGQDHLFGNDGADSLFGDTGDDTLDGGAGNDLLNGGGLHDLCIGGTGTNTFQVCERRQ
jgi:Ca2+-binding RTX toxin-like protein